MSLINEERSAAFRKLLPPEIRSVVGSTQTELKNLIFQNIESAFKGTDTEKISNWIESLNAYVSSECFTFNIDECNKLAQICFDFIVSSKYLDCVTSLIPTFLIFLDPQIKLDITFDWKKIYNIIYNYGLSNSKRKSRKVLTIYLQSILLMIEGCKPYFTPNATEEILSEFSPLWNPKGNLYSLGLTLTCFFLPVNQNKHDLWFSDLISKYALFQSQTVDSVFLPLFERLSFQNISKFNWSPHIPFFFHKLSQFLHIPVVPFDLSSPRPAEGSFNLDTAQFILACGLDDTDICEKFCNLFVNLLSTSAKEAVKDHITKILLLIAPLHSPVLQNADDSIVGLTVDFLNKLVLSYCRRVKSDRRKKSHLSPLTEDDHQWFVSSILPVYVLDLYSNSECEQLKQLVQLLPSVTIPPIFDSLQRLTDYQHLKAPALRTMFSIAPTVIVSNEMSEPFKLIMTPFVDDITSSDVDTTIWVFKLFQVFAFLSPIDDSLSDWACSIVRQCVNFAMSAVGDGFEEALSLMEGMLTAVQRAAEPQILKEMNQILESNIEEIPIENLKILIDSLEPTSFGKWCFNELSERNVVITMCLVRSSTGFIEDHFEKILKMMKETLQSSEEKVRNNAYSLIKWSITSLIRNLPIHPHTQGVQMMTDDCIQWMNPTEEKANKAVQIVDEVLPLLKEIYSKDDNQSQSLATKVASGITKGLAKASSASDYEFEAEPSFPYAKLYQYSFPRISKKLEEVIDWVISITSKSDTLHHQVATNIVNCLLNAVVPIDYLFLKDDAIGESLKILWNDTKLSTMLPSLKSMFSIHLFWLAMKSYSSWLNMIEFPFTKFTKKIIDCAMKFISSPFPSVREVIALFFSFTLKCYPKIGDYYSDQLHKKLEEAMKSQSVQSLATISTVIIPFIIIVDQPRQIQFIIDIGLTLCRPLPADVPDDSLTVLRNTVAVVLDGIDFSLPPFNCIDVKKERMRMIHGAIEKSDANANSTDTKNYAISLIYTVVEGEPLIIEPDILEFMLPYLKSEDLPTCELTLQTLIKIIECLIPRDEIKYDENEQKNSIKTDQKQSTETQEDVDADDQDLVGPACLKFKSVYDDRVYEKVDESNYDGFQFEDDCIKPNKKHKSHLMSRDESNDSSFLSKYFPSETIESRIEVHKVIYNYFLDDPEFTSNLVNLFINMQQYNFEVFYFQRFYFWRTLTRFIGTKFAIKIIEIVSKLSVDDIAALYVSSEVIAGIMASFKSFTYSQIKEVQPSLFDFFRSRLSSLSANSTFSWYLAISNALLFSDSRRYFYLYDFLKTIEFDDSPKQYRQRAELAKMFVYLTNRDSHKFESIFPPYTIPLFQTKVLNLDIQRCSVIDFLTTFFEFTVTKNYLDVKNSYFYDYILPADDKFISDLLLQLFGAHSFGSMSLLPLCIDNIQEWTRSFFTDKDKDEQDVSVRALSSLMISDIVPSVAQLPLTKETARPVVVRVLEQLTTTEKSWPTQVNILMNLLLFISSSYFLIDESLIESIIWDVVSPSLLNQSSDVQDAASVLLSFIFKSFGSIRAKITVFLTMFVKMLNDENDSSQRIAGAKGLFAIVWSTLIFDDVPDYITSAFSALQDASESDSTVTDCINQFFNEFWSEHEENFTENAAIQLSPYKDSLRPSYIT